MGCASAISLDSVIGQFLDALLLACRVTSHEDSTLVSKASAMTPLLLTRDGTVIERVVGAQAESALATFIEAALARCNVAMAS